MTRRLSDSPLNQSPGNMRKGMLDDINALNECDEKRFCYNSKDSPVAESGYIERSSETCQIADLEALSIKSGNNEHCNRDDATGGGFWAWATVVGAFIIQLTGFGYANAFGVYQDYYVRFFLTRSTSSQISWIGSVQTFLMLSLGLFTGRLFDCGYCYHMIVAGSFLLVFSLFMLSLCQPEHYYQVFLAQGLGAGLGASLSYIPSLGVLAQHFHSPHKRALAMCIAVSGSSLGGLIHPIMLNNMFHDRLGFANGVRVSAGFIAVLHIFVLAVIRTNYAGKGREEHNKQINLIASVKKFSKDGAYVSSAIGFALFELVFFFPCFYLQLDAIKHGLSASFSFYSLSILNGASLIGRIAPGFFSRSIGVANMLILTSGACAILMFGMLGVKTIASVAIFGALYGLFSGAYISLMAPMLAILADDPSEIGARMGVAFALSGIGSLIGTPIAGALLTAQFTWWRPVIFDAVVCIAGCALFVGSRMLLGRRKRAGWVL